MHRRNRTIIVGILLVGLFGGIGWVLYTQQAQCIAKHGETSRACVD